MISTTKKVNNKRIIGKPNPAITNGLIALAININPKNVANLIFFNLINVDIFFELNYIGY